MKNLIFTLTLLVTLFFDKSNNHIEFIPLEGPLNNNETIDYSKIKAEFKPASEGLFSEEALYHLILLGENAKYPMWVILDKSTPQESKYDLAYIDRDFDGIVGEEGEKMQTIKKDFYYKFEMENWMSPNEDTGYKITAYQTEIGDEKLQALSINIPVLGQKTYCTITSKSKPKETSKIWIGYEKVLHFMDEGGRKYRFFKGDGHVLDYPYPTNYHKINSTFGYPGTNNSTWYVGISCLSEKESLKATLLYKDTKGKNKKFVSMLGKRCCGFSYYGNIVVPDDAAAGSAQVLINFQDNTNSPFKIIPRIIDVTIYKGEAFPDSEQEKEWREMGWDPSFSKQKNEKRFNEYYDRIFNRFKSGEGKVQYEIMPSFGLNTVFAPDSAYSGFAPGDEIVLSIKVKIDEGYYTYGVEKREGYLNTKMTWTLPKGFELKSLKWPKPTMKKEGGYLIPIYEKEISFNAVIQTPKNAVAGEKHELFARTTFQYCNGVVCTPGEANNVIELTVE